MKFFPGIILCFTALRYVDAYLYPLCPTTTDKSCVGYFKLPEIPNVFDFFNWGETTQEHDQLRKKPSQMQEYEIIFRQQLANFWGAVNVIYESFVPILFDALAFTNENLPFKAEFTIFLQYVPYFKAQKKPKLDGKLYILLLLSGVITYLIAYTYVTRKLFVYYQKMLRDRYISNMKNFLKRNSKDSSSTPQL